MLTRAVIAGVACLVAGGSGTAQAAEEALQDPSTDGHQFSVGVGYWGARSPLEGASSDPETGLVPWVSYANDWMSIDPSGLVVTAIGRERLIIEGLLAPRWLLVDPDDSTAHNDLRRRTGIDLGARVTTTFGPMMASLGYRGDISGRSRGHEVTIETGIGLGLPGGGELGIKGGAYWRDSHLGTWLYGVRTVESRVDRPAWTVDESFTPFAGVMVSYPIGGKLQATFAAEAEYLTGDAADSPIIARRVVPSALLGLFYTF